MKIETHKVNPVNDTIDIEVRDEPGSGGAHHRYDITGFDTDKNGSATLPSGYKSSFSRMIVLFQNGPILENGLQANSDETRETLKGRGVAYKAGQDREKPLLALATGEEECRELVTEMLARTFSWSGYGQTFGKNLKVACEWAGVDLKKVEGEVKGKAKEKKAKGKK